MAITKELQDILSHFRSPGPTEAAKNSFLLSLEGIEGSGKSTLLENLKNELEKQGRRVLCFREPGATAFGEKLREAILDSEVQLHPLSEAHLFASARTQLLHEKVLPALQKEGTVVILDRYLDSSLAYQGEARGLGAKLILGLHQHWPLCLLPHKTFYLAIPLEISLERQRKRGGEKDYFEKEERDFYTKIIQGYEGACKLFPDRILKLDGTRPADEILQKVLAALPMNKEQRNPQ